MAAMEGAEFACLREGLGLSVKWTADWLGVSERKLKRWEDDIDAIPGGVADSLNLLDIITRSVADGLVGVVRTSSATPTWHTYRTDADLREDQDAEIVYAPKSHEDGDVMRFPASWHRALVTRCLREVGGRIVYYVPVEERV